jgi:hypothetical protein
MIRRISILISAVLLGFGLHSGTACAAQATAGPDYSLSCPPDFLTDTEQRMYTKEGTIRSGPWHVRCFQNGTPIYDRDRVYLYCGKSETKASLEGADGHAIRFQFPGEVACVWEH